MGIVVFQVCGEPRSAHRKLPEVCAARGRRDPRTRPARSPTRLSCGVSPRAMAAQRNVPGWEGGGVPHLHLRRAEDPGGSPAVGGGVVGSPRKGRRERRREPSSGRSRARDPSSAGLDRGSAPGAGTEGRPTPPPHPGPGLHTPASDPRRASGSPVPTAPHAAQRGSEAAGLGRGTHLPLFFSFCEF